MNLFQVLGGMTPEKEQEIRDEAFAIFPNIAMQEYGGINTIYTPQGRRDFHGMPVNKYTPQQLEKAMGLSSSRSALREGIFRSVLEKTGDLTTAADAATAAEFTPAGTVMGVQDANIAAQEIIPYLQEGDYKSAGIEALNTAMGYGDAALTALPVVGAGYKAVSKMAPTLTSDAIGLGRSVARGDLEGVRDTFTRSRDPRSLGAAGIGDNGGPPLDQVPARASLFSPSLRAAENLKQNKGTYDQMRGMLLKGGGKEAELEWSGMDRAFAGQKVTKDDLISYLRSNDPRLTQETRESGGKTGVESSYLNFNFDDWFEENIVSDQPMMSQEVNYYADMLSEDLPYQQDVTSGHDLDADEIEDLMERTGLDEEQLVSAEYIIDFGGDDVRLHNDSYDAVIDYYGADEIERMATDSLRENIEYEFNSDPDGFMQSRGIEMNDFDEGDTQYSSYFPYGAENYRENLFQYSDPSGRFPDENVLGASHFGADDDLTQYHTRVGDFDVLDGGRARYVGEIQSDAQQSLGKSGREPLGYELGAKVGDMNAALEPIQESAKMAESMARDYKVYAQNRYDHNSFRASPIIEDMRINAAIKTYNDEVAMERAMYEVGLESGMENMTPPRELLPESMLELSEDQIDMVMPYAPQNASQLIQDLTQRPDILDPSKYSPNEAGKVAEEVKIITELDQYTKEARRTGEALDAAYSSYDFDTVNAVNRGGGPMMASQNRWVDDALRRSIIDAVNDPSVDYLALPQDRDMIGRVGGGSSPKQGAMDFYNRDVQNRLRGILKKVDKDAQPETIRLKSDDINFPAYGLRLTPEFRRRVKEQGLPTFAAFGAMPLLGVFDYLRDQKEKRNERIGGILGYQF